MPSPLARPPLSDPDLDRFRATLEALQRVCRSQMQAASSVLEELRSGGAVTDPALQPPLMAALQALDTAERASIDVADALARLERGTYGSCARCEAAIPVERLELRPFDRLCAGCGR